MARRARFFLNLSHEPDSIHEGIPLLPNQKLLLKYLIFFLKKDLFF